MIFVLGVVWRTARGRRSMKRNRGVCDDACSNGCIQRAAERGRVTMIYD